ncbi:hypothetical protein RC1_2471 [Rhodospirillum centenum SW]|uniref:Uncharacterized protein n=1 Tax=Rhodospirillum centenum (strain ATCC 51521 / SW) TaxID=414684 RepID=B6IUM9_RHOCS|nr:hypothetical protein RC1_2471 [Rhodospirillum centenum SW]
MRLGPQQDGTGAVPRPRWRHRISRREPSAHFPARALPRTGARGRMRPRFGGAAPLPVRSCPPFRP